MMVALDKSRPLCIQKSGGHTHEYFILDRWISHVPVHNLQSIGYKPILKGVQRRRIVFVSPAPEIAADHAEEHHIRWRLVDVCRIRIGQALEGDFDTSIAVFNRSVSVGVLDVSVTEFGKLLERGSENRIMDFVVYGRNGRDFVNLENNTLQAFSSLFLEDVSYTKQEKRVGKPYKNSIIKEFNHPRGGYA